MTRSNRDSLPLLVILAACLLYTTLFFGVIDEIDIDFGRDFVASELLLQGRLPYRDVFYQYGPFAPWLHAGLFWIFGFSTTVILVAGALAGIAIVFLTYFLARQILSRLAAAVAALIVLQTAIYSPHHVNYATPYSFAATYGLLFSLVTLYGASRALDQGYSGETEEIRRLSQTPPRLVIIDDLDQWRFFRGREGSLNKLMTSC